jgi:hypothetical protein
LTRLSQLRNLDLDWEELFHFDKSFKGGEINIFREQINIIIQRLSSEKCLKKTPFIGQVEYLID